MKDLDKEFPELPDYRITSDGQVFRISTGKFRKWVDSGQGYLTMIVVVLGVRRTIKQHQVVMRYHNDDYRLFQNYRYVIDHINCNRSDNRIENLKLVSQRDNVAKELLQKRSLPTGVWFHKDIKKYCCDIHFGDQKYYLGSFVSAELAKTAYDTALMAYEKHGILPTPLRETTKTSKHKHISIHRQTGGWNYRNGKLKISRYFKTEVEVINFKNKVEA